MERLQEHSAGAAVWCRLGSPDEQALTAALDNPDGEALFRRQVARAEAAEAQQRAADREAWRPVCKRCGQKFTDQRWQETTAHSSAWKAGDVSVCGTCRADDVARQEAARTETAWAPAPAQPEPEPEPEDDRDQEPGKPRRGLLRWRT
ncbi:hypothetical protein ADK54_33290 [Streptomyces sp. WM6378]|nr:hypothetical protein ADK54_33290 [Streptomyces sp. WM6378]